LRQSGIGDRNHRNGHNRTQTDAFDFIGNTH
jgi:hypothetical protein